VREKEEEKKKKVSAGKARARRIWTFAIKRTTWSSKIFSSLQIHKDIYASPAVCDAHTHYTRLPRDRLFFFLCSLFSIQYWVLEFRAAEQKAMDWHLLAKTKLWGSMGNP
jgi:hypothetical protein